MPTLDRLRRTLQNQYARPPFLLLILSLWSACNPDEDPAFEGVGKELYLSPVLIELDVKPQDPNNEGVPHAELSSVKLAIQGLDSGRKPAEGAHVDLCLGACEQCPQPKTEAGSEPPKPIDPTPYARFVPEPLDADGRGCTVYDADHLAHCVLPVNGVATLTLQSKGKRYHGRDGTLFVEAVSQIKNSGEWICKRSTIRTGAALPKGAQLSISPSSAQIAAEPQSIACGELGSCATGVRELSLWATLETTDILTGPISGYVIVSTPEPGSDAWISTGSCDDRPSTSSAPFSIWQNQNRSNPFRLCMTGKPGNTYKVTARLDPEYESIDPGAQASAYIKDLGSPTTISASVISTEQVGETTNHKVTASILNCNGTPLPGVRGTFGGTRIDEGTVVDPAFAPVRIEWPSGSSDTSLKFWVSSPSDSPVFLPSVFASTQQECSFTLTSKKGP